MLQNSQIYAKSKTYVVENKTIAIQSNSADFLRIWPSLATQLASLFKIWLLEMFHSLEACEVIGWDETNYSIVFLRKTWRQSKQLIEDWLEILHIYVEYSYNLKVRDDTAIESTCWSCRGSELKKKKNNPNICVKITYIATFEGSGTLFWLPQALHSCTYPQTDTCMYA